MLFVGIETTHPTNVNQVFIVLLYYKGGNNWIGCGYGDQQLPS